MRSGGFLRRRAATDDSLGAKAVPTRLRPGPIPNPFVIEDAIPALEPTEGRCGGCSAPLGADAVSCAVCGRLIQDRASTDADPPLVPSPFVGLTRACIHCGSWIWASASFCQNCGNSRAETNERLPRPEG